MSNAYPKSKFPEQVDNWQYMNDISADTIDLVNQYKIYYNSKNMEAANRLIAEHPELNNCMINAEKINMIIDALKSMQVFYLQNVQTYLQNIVVYRGEYQTTLNYTKYNVVVYNGESYMCIVESCPLGTLPTNAEYFVKLTMTGKQGIAGLGLNFRGYWNAQETYSQDSAVSFNNGLYASKTDNNTSHTPAEGSSYWTLMFDLKEASTYNNAHSGTDKTTYQDAIDELFEKNNACNNTVSSLASTISEHTTKLNGIENGAQVNSITGVKGSNESNYRTGNVNITKANIGLGNVDNTADANKSVNYATSAGNSNTVDGYHMTASTTELKAGVSTLSTNTIYIQYE